MAGDTLYDLLGVPHHADIEEIRAAYRRLSKIYHPDLGGTAATFRQLQEARATLTDPIRRSAYDRFLHEDPRTSRGPGTPLRGNQSNNRHSAPHNAFVAVPYARAQPRAGGVAGVGDEASGNRQRPATSSRRRDPLGREDRGRSRQEIATPVWMTAVIGAGVLVGLLLEPTRGLILILLVMVAIVAWRRWQSIRRRAQRRDRAAEAAVELNRTAREAAEQRATRAASRARQADRDAPGDPTSGATSGRSADTHTTDTAGVGPAAEHRTRIGDLTGALSPAQFEDAMAAFLRSLGLKDLRRVWSWDDPVVDFTARDRVGRTIVVRCSSSADRLNIGAREVQQFIDMALLFHHAEWKLFVTTADFTPAARALAEGHTVRLLNGREVEGLFRLHHQADVAADGR